tara:strand:+ start:237 stop:635 length:399 start_codon:yes stop_codon:yes gene_type:complete
MTDTTRESVEALRSRLVHQCNTALSMPIPMTAIAEVTRQAEEMISALLSDLDAARTALAAAEDNINLKADFIERAMNDSAAQHQTIEELRQAVEEVVQLLWLRMAEGEQVITHTEAKVYQKLRAALKKGEGQ